MFQAEGAAESPGNRKDAEIQKGQCGWSVEDGAEFVCVLLAYHNKIGGITNPEVTMERWKLCLWWGQKHIQVAYFCTILCARWEDKKTSTVEISCLCQMG